MPARSSVRAMEEAKRGPLPLSKGQIQRLVGRTNLTLAWGVWVSCSYC